ncbi:DUF560 domain-containing protein [Aggregatibacter aphrophilus]|jgi:hypothetical protein|nr:DUF560 domain-containing protein [Aggregatibacter aphrophilus]RDE98677.1 DUF560 domain-containing protein [Aggregatibacter aphrophilus]
MKKITLCLLLFYASIANSENAENINFQHLQNNPKLIEPLLSENLYRLTAEELLTLINIYQTFPQYNERLFLFAKGRTAFLQQNYDEAIKLYRKVLSENPTLNPVRIELAIALFNQQQDSAAQLQFEKSKSESNLPDSVLQLINEYLKALKIRQGWQIDLSFHYLRDKNVNNATNSEHIALSNKATLTKSEKMRPQSAHGVAYNLGISRDVNLVSSHYLSASNKLWGKNYWDNHEYDDISNRILIGYTYKTATQTLKVRPFYERRWYGNHRYRWNNGILLEYSHWLNQNWQFSHVVEMAKQHYFSDSVLNGNLKLFSSTLIWHPNPKQVFYLGGDFVAERTRVKQYGSDSKGIRLGLGQEWIGGFSSQIGLSAIKREYKDIAKLGNLTIFSFGKNREDKIYSATILLWKRDWHIWGITPKLQFIWKKQHSNIPQMYSYTQKNFNLVFERTF